MLRRLFKWSGIAFVVMTVAMLAWTFLWPEPDMRDVKRADAIICMGGGMDARGTLAAATLTRVERCVQLFEAGRAPVVVFTGGTARPNGPSAGGQMARFARSLGLPASAAFIEGAAQSTLQNALFSYPLLAKADHVIVVTEAFHLPRSGASFYWAAWELGLDRPSVTLVMSERVRRNPVSGNIGWRILARESLAIWFNAARALAYSASPHKPVDWLH